MFGPRSTDYDFGPGHPLTPRRFGPGIDLLRAIGAEPGLAPEPATDDELARSTPATTSPPSGRSVRIRAVAGLRHRAVRRRARVPGDARGGRGRRRRVAPGRRGDPPRRRPPCAPPGRRPPPRDARRARPGSASTTTRAGGRAQPAGRACACSTSISMSTTATGSRRIHADDPGVMTVSIHESGRYLFPGTRRVDELGGEPRPGRSSTCRSSRTPGRRAGSVRSATLLPELADAFRPDIVVCQHGADSHAWDPLAHLRVTTTAMGAAARLVDELAHRHAGGRWLATGGGGYDVYRVVPRAWAHVWLGGRPSRSARRDAGRLARAVDRGRRRLGRQVHCRSTFDDEPNAGLSPARASSRLTRRPSGSWPASGRWSCPTRRLGQGPSQAEGAVATRRSATGSVAVGRIRVGTVEEVRAQAAPYTPRSDGPEEGSSLRHRGHRSRRPAHAGPGEISGRRP